MQIISYTKQRIFNFCLFFLDAFASNFIVFLVQFHTDEMSVFLDGCNSRSTAAYAVIKYQITFIGICPNKVSD